ncbi:MAG: hypothetical protein LUD18_02540, partial [Lachnospiraceae bacterium]|nr:hypothetical protein [Lachnospiraceae bacterium]
AYYAQIVYNIQQKGYTTFERRGHIAARLYFPIIVQIVYPFCHNLNCSIIKIYGNCNRKEKEKPGRNTGNISHAPPFISVREEGEN